MGTMFANAPIVPTVAAVQVLRISFDAPCRYCRRPATTNIRPVDAIGAPMVADLYVCVRPCGATGREGASEGPRMC